eukprot:TRINITY_DN203_c1_g1_i1.p1 TRINITY_DN203_c1_g1~~TRINITY_DN203_c1_g1_i1.p1  ORF type:complete len:3770 (+),score=310.53 TRINITY_DN203_c1_g1_i1:1284-11312(+)
MAGNPIHSLELPVITNIIIPDSTPPELISFRLDMINTLPPLLLVLTFTETINVNSVDVTLFSLRSSNNITLETQIYNITNATVSRINSTEITFSLSDFDLESIRNRPPLGHSTFDSLLSLSSSSLSDMSNNPVVPIFIPALEPYVNFADNIEPQLVSFLIDLDDGLLILTFSESIESSTFIPTYITLRNGPTLPQTNQYFTLSPTSFIQMNFYTIQLLLPVSDQNDIKRNDLLAINVESTYISLQAAVIEDIAGNNALPISSNNSLIAGEFISDTTRPMITAFNFNFQSCKLSLFFNEVINSSATDPTFISFVNIRSIIPTEYYQLTGGTFPEIFSTSFDILLSHSDKNKIKELENLATNEDNLYLIYTDDLAYDMNGNRLIPRTSIYALKVTNYTFDLVKPVLLSYALDMNIGTLELSFNETVDVNTLQIGELTLLNDQFHNASKTHTLTDSIVQTHDSDLVDIYLSSFDLNEIKRKEFCRQFSDCYLTFSTNTIRDQFNISIDGIREINTSIPVFNYIPDTSRPMLFEFTSFDHMDGQLTLSFSETVNISSIDFTAITLQDFSEPPIQTSYTLTGGVTRGLDDTTIVVYLSSVDIIAIQSSNLLCTLRSNCYITLTDKLVKDMVGLPLTPVINSTVGFVARYFGHDLTRPSVKTYAFDMDSGVLSVSFNEPIDLPSINFSAILLQGNSNLSNLTELGHEISADFVRSSKDFTHISIYLTDENLLVLKSRSFAKSFNTTFLSIDRNAFTDTAYIPNQVIPIPSSNGLPLNRANYTSDTTPPYLVCHSLDMDSDQIVLTFNELVNPSSVNCSAIVLYNSSLLNSTMFELSGCTVLTDSYMFGTQINIQLSREDLIILKSDLHFLTKRSNSYLSLRSSAIYDTQSNPSISTFQQSCSFVPDSTRAIVIAFSIDMNLGIILLTFDDVILSSSFDPASLSLQHSKTSTPEYSFTLSTSSSTQLHNDYVMRVNISHFDLLGLKSTPILAKGLTTTYLTYKATLFDDTMFVDIIPITDGNGLLVSQFIADDIPPTLLLFDLDLDVGVIALSFSDTVNTDTFLPTGVTLISADNIELLGSTYHRLTGGNYVRSSNGTLIYLEFNTEDLNRLKLNTNIAVNTTTSYIAIISDSIRDLHNNSLVAVQNTTALQVRNFFHDVTNPDLVAFSLDMNTGLVFLTFNEIVNAGSFMAAQVTLHNPYTEMFTLTGGFPSPNDSTILIIQLISADIHSLNRLRSLATSINTTFISFTNLTVLDMNSNNVNTIYQYNPLQASEFTKDITLPSLLSFSFDLNTGEVKLYFSEVISSESFKPSQLTFLNKPFISEATFSNQSLNSNNTQYLTYHSYILTTGNVTLQDDLFIQFALGLVDLNAIKAIPQLATNQYNTYMAYTSFLVSDTFGNAIIPFNLSNPINVSEYTFDITSPRIFNFDFDLDVGQIIIHFTETVNTSTLNVNEVVLHNGRMLNSPNYTLTSSLAFEEYSPDLIIRLSQDDSDMIKSLTDLAVDKNTTFIFIGESAVLDMNMNSYALFDYATQVNDFIYDVTSPVLLSFDLDMNLAILALTFSEAVDISSFDKRKIFIGSDEILSTNYSLYFSSPQCNQRQFTSTLTRISQLELCIPVFYYLKFDLRLATSENNTFIKLSNGAIMDFSNNPVIEIIKPVSTFTVDITDPALNSFILDMNLGKLYLYFSEPINSTSLDVSTISLQAQSTISEFISLTLQSYLLMICDLPDSAKYACVVIQLSYHDVNSIKNSDTLATQSSNTFIVITNETIEDTSMNPVVPIPTTNALFLNSSNYINDITRPTVLSFSLDMDAGVLTVTFNEEVQRSTLDINDLILQPSMFHGFGTVETMITSTNQVVWNCCEEIFVAINLTKSDINTLKLDDTVATRRNNSYLRFSDLLVQDHAGNLLNSPVIIQEGLLVANFTPDTTPPVLFSFKINLNPPESMELLFSEPVRVSTFNVKSLTLLGAPNATNPLLIHTLTGETYQYRINSISITVILNFTDTLEIQSRPNLASNFTNVFLSTPSTLISDMNGNPLVEIPRTNPIELNIDDYTEDSTPPSLSSYTLNLNTGKLILTYSETVKLNSLQVDFLILQVTKGSLSTVPSYKLTNGSVTTVNGRDWYIVSVAITYSDLTNIQKRARENLATSAFTTFLSIDSRHATDIVGLDFMEINDDEAKIVEIYIPDTTKPVLLIFDLDISTPTGTILLLFSEVVDIVSFNAKFIELHNSAHILNSTQKFILSTANIISNEDDISILFSLDTSDLNEMKRLTNLATSPNNTYIYLGNSTVNDMYGNPVDDKQGNTIRVRNISVDSTQPRLDSFDFDLNTGSIILTFSETVNSSSFDVTQIHLRSNSSLPYEIFGLTNLSSSSQNDSHIITVHIHVDDLNSIKSLRSLGTAQTTTYLSHTPYLVSDMQGLLVIQETGKLVNIFIPDDTPPQLVSFNFNLISDMLSLTFDEAIAYAHVMISKFQIRSQIVGGSIVPLTNGEISPYDSTVINISLFPFDLNEIKSDLTLAVSLSSTFLELMADAVTDTAGNSNTPIIQMTNGYRGDNVAPSLDSYALDINVGRLRLNFDEIVSSTSAKVTFITLSDQPYSVTNYTLTGGIWDSTFNSTMVEIYFTTYDLNAIKRLNSLAISLNTSYLTLLSNFIQDSNLNPINEVLFKKADIFINDSNAPYVLSFDLDMNVGTLTVKFNETVDFRTFNVTGLTIQASPDASPSQRYRFTSGILHSLIDNSSLTFFISQQDLNEIKASIIAKNVHTTWLTADTFTLLDHNLQSLVPLINGVTSKQVSNFLPDVTPPLLNSFNIDLSLGRLYLFFSETIDIHTVNVTFFTLQNNSMTIDQLYSLTTTSIISSEHSSNITITLSSVDLNEIKRKTDLVTAKSNTFLSVKRDALRDRYNNSLSEISNFNALQVSELVIDQIRPSFIQFSLDLDAGLITMIFSETMNSSSISIDRISLLSSNYTGASRYTLLSAVVLTSDAPSVILRISDMDLNAIKLLEDLATSTNCLNSTFISLTSDTISDSFGNVLVPVTSSRIHTCILDETRPILTSYQIDLNLGRLILTFNEAVNASTIRFEVFKLYSSRPVSNTTQTILLGGDSTSSFNGVQITITISHSNLNEIKRLTSLGTNVSNTFLEVLSQPEILDMSGNSLVPIHSNNTIMASEFVGDTTSPELVEYSLNMDNLSLSFTFTETVNASSLNPVFLSIQHAPTLSHSNSFLTLTGGSVDLQDSTIIRLNLTLDDSNCLKASPQLAIDVNSTYIVYSSRFVEDMNQNMVIDISNGLGKQVESYVIDSTPPILQSFDLDLDEGHISFRFTESVNSTTLDITGLSLQTSDSPPNSSFTFTGN